MNSEPQMIQRPRKWPRYVGIVLGLLVVLYFVVTSSPFLRSVVLPQVESAIGSKLDVGDLSLSPFSQLDLRNVKITPKGAEPLAQIDLIRLRYSLWSLLRGNIQAYEITVENPTRVCGGASSLDVDGARHDARIGIPLVDDGNTHRVRVVLGPSSTAVASNG